MATTLQDKAYQAIYRTFQKEFKASGFENTKQNRKAFKNSPKHKSKYGITYAQTLANVTKNKDNPIRLANYIQDFSPVKSRKALRDRVITGIDKISGAIEPEILNQFKNRIKKMTNKQLTESEELLIQVIERYNAEPESIEDLLLDIMGDSYIPPVVEE